MDNRQESDIRLNFCPFVKMDCAKGFVMKGHYDCVFWDGEREVCLLRELVVKLTKL